MKRILKGIVLSILVFLSISFITVLVQLNTPFHSQINSTLNIGYPFTYYSQFTIDTQIPNSGWNIINLLLDCIITWIIVVWIYFWKTKFKKQG